MNRISIITICYNSAATIEDTINSVLAQDYPNVEYIIIDGASKDNTIEIVKRHEKRIAKIISEPDNGIYDAMNKGVLAATGHIVGILNSDDVYSDNKVLSDVMALFETENCDAVYADLKYVAREDTSKTIRYWKSGVYKSGDFIKGWMPPHPAFFVKSECYRQFGNYSTELRSAADYELMLRMIHKHGISIRYLPRITTLMRVGGESNVTFKNRLRANREDQKAWEMNGLKPGLFTLLRKPLSKLIQFIR